jgi:hypothetical protein
MRAIVWLAGDCSIENGSRQEQRSDIPCFPGQAKPLSGNMNLATLNTSGRYSAKICSPAP